MHSDDEARLRSELATLQSENSRLRAEIEQLKRESEQKRRLEDELREREARLQLVLNQLPAVLCTLDPHLRFTSANGAGLRLLDLDAEQITGKSVAEVLAPHDPTPVLEALTEALQGVPKEFEYEFKKRLFQGWLEPLRGADGSVEGIIGFAIDITDIRRLQMQIEQAQRLESIGRLAGGIAHDFNNVLAGISGFAELAQMQLPEEHPAQPYLRQIRDAVARSSQMVSQLLAFARRRVIYPQPMSLNEHLQRVLGILQQILGEDIELNYYLDEQLGTVRADPAQIEQVLVNLVSNARQAMPRGGSLTIETQNVALDDAYVASHWQVKPGEYVLIAITDTGEGIAPEHLPHLFEPFYTTHEGGTGLGLATVHGIVSQAGGYIWVYSEPGKGTTFKIYLPRVHEAPQPLEKVPNEAPAQGDGARILLVEDNPDVLETTAALLRSLGYSVQTATMPSEAIAIAQSHPIDLLITDVVLPQMRGSALAQTLQASHPKMKVLYISGYTENSIIEQGELKLGVAFLAKPYTLSQLAAKVREVLTQP